MISQSQVFRNKVKGSKSVWVSQWSTASSSRQTLLMGLVKNPVYDLIQSRRTSPFLSIMVSTILPVNQELRGAESSTMMTMSPGVKLRLMLDHFCRSCIWGRYSLIHLFQNKSDIYWTCLHLRRAYRSSFWNCPGGKYGVVLRSRSGFQRSESQSFPKEG